MSTTKNRINITLDDDVRESLIKIAKRDNVPQATKAASLLEIALELEEDQIWDEIAEKRNKKKVEYVAHDKAWRHV